MTQQNNYLLREMASLNQDLLSKVRTLDPETGEYRITGKLGLDDLPKNIDDAPDYIVGPQLVPVTDTGNYTTSIMEWGWDWLGEANARLSREPMVLSEMIKMRKQFDESGFERLSLLPTKEALQTQQHLLKQSLMHVQS